MKREAEIVCLERQLDLRQTETREARLTEREWRTQLHNVNERLAEQQEETLDITSDMSRQYKAMQADMTRANEALELELRNAKLALTDKEAEMAAMQADFELRLREKDTHIKELQSKLEDLAHEFSEMLKETLEKMSSKIAEEG